MTFFEQPFYRWICVLFLVIFVQISDPAGFSVAMASGDHDTSDDSHDDDDSDDDDDDSSVGSYSGESRGIFGKRKFRGSHQNLIRNAVQRKQILSLSRIKRIIKNKTKSEIISIELERVGRSWVYEFKIVNKRGRLRELKVNARNGKILRSYSD